MKQLMTHIVAGYPTIAKSQQLALTMAKSGVSFIEIQIPFSDPVADGRTIMEANQVALENGTTPEDCFELMARLKHKTHIPLLFMTYFNIPFRYGLEKFCERAKAVGAYGLIIPDIPIDEEPYDHYIKLCKKHDLHPIQVISSITPEERLKRIGKVASGFVYCVTGTRTTGERKELDSDSGDYLSRVRKHIRIPLALGFGISSKKQVKAVLKKADIAVIGSKILKLSQSCPSGRDRVRRFILSLNSARI
ncbi:MAG: tryptophan synthase subunit alpha [bacterium]|nr:tryptophan synthase subunit alpha [bacterium]